MRAKRPRSASAKRLFDDLAALRNHASRKRFFRRHRRSLDASFARHLIEVVVPQGRVDTQRALALADAAVLLSRELGDKEILGLSLRAKANALNLAGKNQQALQFHRRALNVFERLKNQEEVGRSLSASLQPLILLGDYDRAFAAAERAREIFTRLGEKKRLARLDNNVGNIYHRQDRFEEALACYERSYDFLLPFGDSEELAIALSNIAVCLISLNDYPRALSTYERARGHCDEHKLPLLRAQADYNIAYLYYLRGEYGKAIEMLHAARRQCEATGERYHFALCHLDLSEIYLELNLSAEARDVAHEGYLQFQNLGMGYEEAKCLANEAIASSQLGQALHALDLFGQARVKFVAEKNLVWPWLIDLYQAIVLFDEGRFFEARRLCLQAAGFFDRSSLAGKAVLCHLLLARLSLREGDLQAAHAECAQALDRLGSLEAPVLHYQAHFLRGEIRQAAGDLPAAYESLREARQALEALRSSLRGEELKIAFMKNRLEVYENLVALCLSDKTKAHLPEESFEYIELAKSRSLAELLVHHAHFLPASDAGQSGLVRRIREMREELNWYYRRIELEQFRTGETSPRRIEKLQKEALAHENELLRALREIPVPESAEAVGRAPALLSLENIRAALPPGAVLIEFFSLKQQFMAGLLTAEGLEFVLLTPVSRVANLLRMLHFQLSKFRLGSAYLRTFEQPLLAAVRAHLAALYEELVAPLRARLRASHLVIVPHGILHYVPFHALFDGHGYLIDSFSVSYAPSASIFALCEQTSCDASGPPLILGVPDSRAPFIQDEVQSVAGCLPSAELVLGSEASETALRRSGSRSRMIHIATHGNFRKDNPMFSGIRLGAAYLNLYDLYQLELRADLVTLSGCATGLSVVAAGDELLGLVRGLLYAGAQSLLLTLWDVHDRSTSEFMSFFYRHLRDRASKTWALRAAVQDLRARYPHPYYWAPFVLIGKVSPA